MKTDRSQPEYIRAIEKYVLGDRVEARKAFEALIVKYPDDPTLHLLLGTIKYSLGLLNDASRDFEKSLELDPDYAQAYFRLGECLVRMGMLDKALDCFRKNIELKDQGHVMAYYWMGLINNFLGNDDEALTAFDRLHEESRESRFANLFLAQLLMKRNENERALRLLTELVEVNPGFAEVHYLMGLVYMRMFRTFDAIRCFRKTLQSNPSDSRAKSAIEQLTEVPSI